MIYYEKKLNIKLKIGFVIVIKSIVTMDLSLLSDEQLKVFTMYLEKKNIFVTGPGGSGKSLLIKYIYQHALLNGKNIQICATTGRAALLLDCKAKTIHSWAGIGLGKGDIITMGMKIANDKKRRSKWVSTDILIIDEVSMMSCKLFEMLNHIGQKVRKNSVPFGGIHVLFFGDFYQLPPVFQISSDECEGLFCFESPLWEVMFPQSHNIQLTKIYRQQDQTYASILNKLRVGKISKKGLTALESRVGLDTSHLEIAPTKLFPVKRDVDCINNACLEKLTDENHCFRFEYVSVQEMVLTDTSLAHYNKIPSNDIQRELDNLEKNMNGEPLLQLKKGAQVMCVVNLDMEGEFPICNGSLGIVSDFPKNEKGQVIGIKVNFANGCQRLINKHMWKSELNEGIAIKQYPLVLAWAMTIHKSQGATLDLADIDAGSSIFAAGQTYVALSRVKSLDGLYLKSFDISKIKINKKVRDFYEKLNSS